VTQNFNAMITLHHLETSRSQRILWLLEELGLPYELKRYQRDPKTRLAPPELKAIHPLGKSPVITDGSLVIAESGAIIEYLSETYGLQSDNPDLKHLIPIAGTQAHRDCRFWMHYAEGSLMNWLVMKLVFSVIPTQPMPFFVKPIAKGLSNAVQTKLIDPNLGAALPFMDEHLGKNEWFAGQHLTMADFQMSFAVEAALNRASAAAKFSHLQRFKERINARYAYKIGIEKGGPVVGKFSK
jgi:glutathione S-transferase